MLTSVNVYFGAENVWFTLFETFIIFMQSLQYLRAPQTSNGVIIEPAIVPVFTSKLLSMIQVTIYGGCISRVNNL